MKLIDLHQDLVLRIMHPYVFGYSAFSEQIEEGIRKNYHTVITAIFPLTYSKKGVFEINTLREALTQLSIYRELNIPNRLSIEGCYNLSVSELSFLADLGVEFFGFTWNHGNDFASGCMDKRDYGLTDKGEQAINLFNQRNLALDFAHLSYNACKTIIEENLADNVFISHTGVREIVDFKRNSPMEIITSVADKKGIIGLTISKKMSGDWDLFVKAVSLLMDEVPDAIASGSDLYGTDPKTAVFNAYEAEDLRKLREKLSENFSQLSLDKMFYKNAEAFLSKVG